MHMPAFWIGAAFILLTVSGMFGSALSAAMTKKLGRKISGRLLFCLAAAACVLLAVEGRPLTAVLAAVLLRVSYMSFAPLNAQLQNEQVKTGNRATELSANALVAGSVGVVTNLAFGRLAEESFVIALLAGAVLCVAALVLFSVFTSKQGA